MVEQWTPIAVPAGVQPGDIATKDIFKILKFDRSQQTYIETGTYLGGGIKWALNYFEEVHSIEILERFYQPCVEKFKNNSKVHIHLGDSRTILSQLLKQINKPCFIFLDAHGDINEQGPNPLYNELEAIKNHSIKNHVIVIDDLRRIGDPSDPCWSKISRDELKLQLQSINKEYEVFEYNDSIVAMLTTDKTTE